MGSPGIAGDDRAMLAALEALERNARTLPQILPAVGGVLVADAQLAFRGARDPWGTPWAALSQTTLIRRAARRTGGRPYKRDGKLKKAAAAIIASAKPLLDTGVLRNSITFRVEGDRVVVGTNLKYAGPQQFGAAKGAFGATRHGAPIPWGTIRARNFLPVRSRGGGVDLPRAVIQQITALLETHLRRP